MSAIISAASVAVLGTAVCLVLKRSNAEMTVPLSIALVSAAFFLIMGLFRPILEFLEEAKALSGLSDAVFAPVLKCVGIGMVAKLSSDLCRDGGQSAMASSVELAGAVCAAYVALPLLSTLLDMLEGLL